MSTGLLSLSFRMLAFVAACAAATVLTAAAEPITITSGQLYQPDDEPGFFSFVGADGFVLTAGFPVYASLPWCTGAYTGRCAPGMSLNLSTVLGGEVAGHRLIAQLPAEAIVNGINFSPSVLMGTLRFDAPTIVLPPLDQRQNIFTAPFALSGEVTGFALDDLDARNPLFHVGLTGQGRLRMIFDLPEGPATSYPSPELTYEFAPVPEPASMVLLGTGLAAVGVRRWRQSRANVKAPSAS